MSRRRVLGAGLAAGAAATVTGPVSRAMAAGPFDPGSWASVRDQFILSRRYAQFSAFMLPAHPAPVREAIARVRDQLDVDPYRYGLSTSDMDHGAGIRTELAARLGGAAEQVALVDSTTMGLGLVYGGVRLAPGDEVLTSDHDFYATHEALRLRAEVSGATVRRIPLYGDPATATVDEILTSLAGRFRPDTRVLALTWVHSSTGVKLPIRDIADLVAAHNRDRAPAERMLLCVDGVHGFCVDDVRVADLGADVFVSSAHKWLFGPRGTGFVWATPDAWARITPVIPSFSLPAIIGWITGVPATGPAGELNSPGGYHSFENRWAVPAALEFRDRIGPARIAERVATQATRLKDQLAELPNVRLVTPRDQAVSAGIVCFGVAGLDAATAVERLFAEHRIAATDTPYAVSYARLGPSIVTSPAEVDRAVRAIAQLS